MKNLKISAKLVLSFGLITVLLAITMVIAFANMRSMNTKINYYSEAAIPVINSMWTARRAMVATERAMFKATTTNDKATTQAHIDDAQKQLDSLRGVLEVLESLYSGDKQDIQKFRDLMNSTVQVKEESYALLLENKNVEAVDKINNEYIPIFVQAGELLVKMAEGVQGRVDAFNEEADRASGIALVLLIAMTIFGLTTSILICAIITRTIRVPITELQSVANKMADGDLSVEVNYTSGDEFGLLADDMRKLTSTISGIITDLISGIGAISNGDFTAESAKPQLYVGDFAQLRENMYLLMDKLSVTLGDIDHAADQVSAGSEQVSSGSQALSQGATEQASSVEELSATLTEIAGQIKDTASNAEEASEKTRAVSVEVEGSNSRMNDMLVAMTDISNTSSEIGKIIKSIEDIAFQTNILALNAAVEAARAGAAGKGFAVVADEVRNLASKSADASKNTAALIEGSLKAVENGTRIADETAQALQAVVSGVADVTNTINMISSATREQAESITQLTVGVDQISSVVQTNSATAEESAASSEELSGQATMLKSLVSKFKIRKKPNGMF